MLTEIKACVERVTFYNPDNHYAVLRVDSSGETVTVTGNFVSVSEGQMLLIKGKWEEHPKYGRQFKAIHHEELPLPTAQAVERYLGSGLIKGIGPVMAKKIVEKFGKKALEIIDKYPERLSEIEGIGTKKLAGLKKSLNSQKDLKDVMVALQEYEITPAYAMRIYKQYGRNCVQILKENPYRLAEDVSGIGFIKADQIAARTGIPKDSPFRAEAGLLYLLERLSEEGHVFYPYNELLAEAEKGISISRESLLKGIAALFEKKKIVMEELLTEKSVSSNNKAVYLKRLHDAEADTAHGFRGLLKAQAPLEAAPEDALEWVQKELSFRLSARQSDAVKGALKEKVFIITGGPGVGKTTIIKAILRIYQKWKKRVLLAAPTGRAAKRLSELTGEEAKTIHRLLEYSPVEQSFRRNEIYPLQADMIILDESSMIDIMLMSRFLKAVPRGCGLILVGDANQLASVGPGNVLKDLIESGSIPSVRLDEIFRQSRESLIVVNAHKINNGEMPFTPHSGAGDFHFIQMDDTQAVLDKIIELCTSTLPQKYGFNPLRDIQVLSPMHKGLAGVANLNRTLQAILNRREPGSASLAAGDKVMQVKNDYEKDVFNGDTGWIKEVRKGEVLVDFDGRDVVYENAELDKLQLAYAASVHKSQGSEYPAVVMPIVTEHFILLQKNLLYTAVTRAKRMMVLVGSKKALAIAVKNSKTALRYTALRRRLAGS
ncbi:MAG: ATP-dependent RecD-like DNA helicase [Nitrospiraceae bacterium]|nr:ATP-dependent RecD-like DNA helicase [Nitrospiraceae bacterium]